jgi:hypothetical protein
LFSRDPKDIVYPGADSPVQTLVCRFEGQKLTSSSKLHHGVTDKQGFITDAEFKEQLLPDYTFKTQTYRLSLSPVT